MRSVAIVILLTWLLLVSSVIAVYGINIGEPRLVAMGLVQCFMVLLLTWSIVKPVQWWNLCRRMRNIELSFECKDTE